MTAFDLTHPLPTGRTVLEASAGTGKTYSLTGLIVRYVAEVGTPVEQFLVVTFTRAAANELRDRTRATLDVAAAALRTGSVPTTHPWMTVLFETPFSDALHDRELDRRRARLADAIGRFDEMTITTIHGFCQQALAQLGVRSGNNPDAVLVESINDVIAEVCRDAVITELADDPTALNSPPGKFPRATSPKQVETELVAVVGSLMANPGSVIVPTAGDHPLADRWVALAIRTHEAVIERQNARGEIGYDTLISGLQRALTDPDHGPAVVTQLAQRSSVVLVDEFQDTDRLQWEVFDTAFADRILITVGDPKQAIYRFRGADVHAYLDAVQHGSTLSLATNHRSDALLLDGLAHLFDRATLGDPRIGFVPVAARPDASSTAFTRSTSPDTAPDAADIARPSAAVHLRMVRPVDHLRTTSGRELSMPLVRSLVLNDLVERTIDLLDHGWLAEPTAEPSARAETDGGRRRVRAGDIAVLVATNADANNVAEALRRAHIPAVRTRTGTVLATPAAMQWRLLLAALAQPHQTAVVRAAALGWFLATDISELADDDAVLAALQMRAADLGDRLRAVGVSAFYDERKARVDRASSESDLVGTVLGRDGGERHLTDLDHISELLATAMQGRAADPAQVLRVLDGLIADTDERNEATMRRIDSDSLAVQITTIHSAKGLEYPIVLVPFAFKPRANLRTPYSYTTTDGKRTLDLASRVSWDAGPAVPGDDTSIQNQEMRRFLAAADVEGDELRLLYVALTRAQHRLEIWWASTQRANGSALGRVFVDRFGAGPVQNSADTLSAKPRGGFKVDDASFRSIKDADAFAQIEMLAAHSDGTIDVAELDDRTQPAIWAGRSTDVPTRLSPASSNGRAPITDHRWKRWSFSRLGSVIESERDQSVAVDVGLSGDGPVVDTPTIDALAAELTPDGRGGFDEPIDPFDDVATLGAEVAVGEQLQLGVGPVAHLANVVGGTRFGTFVHSVLEHLDFAAPDLRSDVVALVVDQAAREGLDIASGPGAAVQLDDVVNGIVAAVRTPLGPLFDGHSLADIGPADRLDELTFDIPIAAATGSIRAGAIGQVLLANLGRRDPIRPFATSLAGEFAQLDIAGWMHGSIDAVLRIPVDGVQRYFVIDYKTNRLHQPGASDPVAAYRPDLLVPAMEHSRYPLQALLYTLALHRYLRWRLGQQYDPDRHLGGIGYLFLRGMVGPATPVMGGVAHGVFSWRPPTDVVLALDHLFATGRTP